VKLGSAKIEKSLALNGTVTNIAMLPAEPEVEATRIV
jgi:hypothetical protein